MSLFYIIRVLEFIAKLTAIIRYTEHGEPLLDRPRPPLMPGTFFIEINYTNIEFRAWNFIHKICDM